MSGTKDCFKCGMIKDTSEFHKNKRKADGLSHTCKNCERERKQKDRIRLDCPERRLILLERSRSYYTRTEEHQKELSRLYYVSNKSKCLSNSRRWAEKNRDRMLALQLTAAHKKRSIDSEAMTAGELQEWLSSVQRICFWCNDESSTRFEIDHFISLSAGGGHVKSNLVLACASCNRKKGNSDPYDFAQRVGKVLVSEVTL